jgi:hypothetical protein
MQVDCGIGQGIALPLGSGTQQKCTHACCQANADGGNCGTDELHGIIDGETSADNAPGAVDIKTDVLIRILSLQVEKLSHDEIGDLIVDWSAQHNYTLPQQQRIYIIGTLPSDTTFNYHGDYILR